MTTTFHLYLRKDFKKKNGEYPIYLRLTYDRKHKYMSTGISIKEKDWNFDREVARKTHSNYKTINEQLQLKIREAEKVQLDLSRNGNDTATAITERLQSVNKADFFIIADIIASEFESERKFYASKHIKVVLKKLEAFEKVRFLSLKRIDTAYLENFERFLVSEYKNKPNTIHKDFKVLRKVIKRALKHHLLNTDPFYHFEGAKKKKSSGKTKLTLEQVKGIEALKVKKNSGIYHAKNAFLFSFYSAGIRFGDICCLTWNNVRGNKLNYTMNKNDKGFSTELNKQQKEILASYSNSDSKFIFPFLHINKEYADPMELRKDIGTKNALVNKNLKLLVKLLNTKIDKGEVKAPRIEESVSFHVSRHSFAQHAVESGLDVYGLMHTLRHSNIETTQQYLKGLDEELADKAMKQVFK